MTLPIKEVVEMRYEGATLREIGSHFNVSAERIRQVLEREYGTSQLNMYMPESHVAQLLGVPASYMRKLRDEGVVTPTRREKGHIWLYTKVEIEKARDSVKRRECTLCGKRLTLAQTKFCSECGKKVRHNRYLVFTPEQKKIHSARMIRWRKEHPEWVKAHQREYSIRYQAKVKKNIEENEYVVRGRCVLPIGTIFKAVRIEFPNLILEDGAQVPVSCTRLLRKKGGKKK